MEKKKGNIGKINFKDLHKHYFKNGKYSKDYHDYVIKNGRFIGAFEEMYQNIEDPWHHGDATSIQYDIDLYLIDRYGICAKGGEVLDIGCGRGAFTARLKKQMPHAQILAIDVASTAVRKATEKYKNFNIDFKVIDIQSEHIIGRFDLIVMSQVMWYILPTFEKVISCLKEKNLKNNGYLLINQAFYKSEEQKYGRELVSSVEDMFNLIKMDIVEMIELNRFGDYNAIILFKKKQKILKRNCARL